MLYFSGKYKEYSFEEADQLMTDLTLIAKFHLPAMDISPPKVSSRYRKLLLDVFPVLQDEPEVKAINLNSLKQPKTQCQYLLSDLMTLFYQEALGEPSFRRLDKEPINLTLKEILLNT